MYPTIFKYGDTVLSSFSLMVLVAYFVGYKVFEKEILRRGYDEKVADISLAAVLIGGLGGSKLLFLFQNATFSEFISDPTRYIASGYSSLGGLFGSILLLIVVANIKKVNYWTILDIACPAMVIGYAIGRIGCLLVGDDYGITSNLPWAISFPKGSPPTYELVHPTQIYDTVLMTLLFIFLWKIRKYNDTPGWLASIGFIAMGIQRFLIEFIRNTTPSFIEGISQAQLFCLLLIVIFLVRFGFVSISSNSLAKIK